MLCFKLLNTFVVSRSICTGVTKTPSISLPVPTLRRVNGKLRCWIIELVFKQIWVIQGLANIMDIAFLI